mgnify:CR=1 FL=1
MKAASVLSHVPATSPPNSPVPPGSAVVLVENVQFGGHAPVTDGYALSMPVKLVVTGPPFEPVYTTTPSWICPGDDDKSWKVTAAANRPNPHHGL